MKKIFYSILLSFLIQQFILPQQGWQLIYSFPEDVGAICFLDSNIGFAGSGFSASIKKIMKTTDSGNSWNDLLVTNNAITRIYFYNYSLGLAIGENGTLYKTTDSGGNWILFPLGETETFRGIYFYNEQKGWGCIGADKIIRTTDGGNNWISSFTPGAVANYDIEFVNELIGFTVGVYARMYTSTDGGAAWNEVTAPLAASMFDIEFFDQSNGIIVGGSGVARTTDGGNMWSQILNTGGTQLNSVCTSGNKFAWAVGQDKIYYTSNSGDTWTSQSFTPYSYLQQVSCADSVNVWVLGDRKLYRTSTGGVTIVNDEVTLIPEGFLLSQNYPNPFNPTTTITYEIPERGYVILKVYDILGREVTTLVNEEKPAGIYEVQFIGNELTSGIYFYQINAGEYSETKKMILLR